MAVPVNREQHEYMPGSLGEPVNRISEVPQFASVRLGHRRLRRLTGDLDAILLALGLAHHSQHRIHCDAV